MLQRLLGEHGDIHLSALGMAVSTMVSIAEILKKDGLAVETRKSQQGAMLHSYAGMHCNRHSESLPPQIDGPAQPTRFWLLVWFVSSHRSQRSFQCVCSKRWHAYMSASWRRVIAPCKLASQAGAVCLLVTQNGSSQCDLLIMASIHCADQHPDALPLARYVRAAHIQKGLQPALGVQPMCCASAMFAGGCVQGCPHAWTPWAVRAAGGQCRKPRWKLCSKSRTGLMRS